MKKIFALGTLTLFLASMLMGCSGTPERKKVVHRSKPKPNKKEVVKPGDNGENNKKTEENGSNNNSETKEYPQETPKADAVLVKEVPEEPAAAEKPEKPEGDHIWMPGRWFPHNGKYHWAKGKWKQVPKWMIEKNYYWKKGHWAQAPDGAYFYVKGGWATK